MYIITKPKFIKTETETEFKNHPNAIELFLPNSPNLLVI